MTCVLGMELFQAESILAKEGFDVCKQEISCKKGPAGECNRVIRQKLDGDGRVVITYAGFRAE